MLSSSVQVQERGQVPELLRRVVRVLRAVQELPEVQVQELLPLLRQAALQLSAWKLSSLLLSQSWEQRYLLLAEQEELPEAYP